MPGLRIGWSRADFDAVVARHSGDPLGLRAWANRVERDLTPGVTNVTNSVQGYALFCAGVDIAGQAARTTVVSADEAFRRFEALWVHAQTRHQLAGDTSGRWPGFRAASRVATERVVDLSIGLLTQPLASGIFGAYRRSAMRFGLAHPPLLGGAIRPATIKLTSSGRVLAELCLGKLWVGQPAGSVPLLKILRAGRATGEQLRDVRADEHPRPEESAIIGAAVVGVDRVTREGLKALRACYDALRGANPNEPPDMFAVLTDPVDLTPSQNDARRNAEVIQRLVEEIEHPYRSWLVGDDVPAPSSTLWDDEHLWTVAEAGGVADALALRKSGRTGVGWDGVHECQQKLAALRGGEPLERNFVPIDYASALPPAFGLNAVGSLFDDGLLDRGPA